ncbi:class I SAM-dependent methyltransferase [Desulfovibrio sp. JC010]|uniref:class I SAM-dependent methyltransferase n=1 Tax=Desulfovibrio sp. JC010 TaxID=2593641 RepID=UPI0013D3AA8F|nr:class I SAM-dependent methyltransferase [Desulfovibrio sp. JC010]
MFKPFRKEILETLRCPECKNKVTLQSDQDTKPSRQYRCTSCTWISPDTATPDFTPSEGLKLPNFAKDPDLIRFNQHRQAVFDYSHQHPLVSLVEESGHKTIRSFRQKLATAQNKTSFVLDLGCGDGAHIPFMLPADIYLAADINMHILETLVNRYPEIPAIRADGYDLPFADNSFDAVINVYNLEHMIYCDLCLEEMARVAKKDGDIFISVPCEGGFAWSFGRYLSTAKNFSEADFDYLKATSLEHVNCIWQLEKAIKRHFRIEKATGFPLPYMPNSLSLIKTYHCKLAS